MLSSCNITLKDDFTEILKIKKKTKNKQTNEQTNERTNPTTKTPTFARKGIRESWQICQKFSTNRDITAEKKKTVYTEKS